MSQTQSDVMTRFSQSLSREMSALWVGFWSLIVLAVDFAAAQEVIRAASTLTFPSVTGQITQSTVCRDESESDGHTVVSFRPDVRYRYSVNGQEFTGDQIRFAGADFAESLRPSGVQELVRRFSAGQSVIVFYDPTAPGRSALDRQIGGRALFLAMILLPFNLVMLAGWTLVSRRWRGLSRRPMRREGTRWIVRRGHGDPWLVALIVAGAIDFLAMLIAAASDWQQSTWVMSAYWLCLIGASAVAFVHTRQSALSEPPTLIVDDAARTVTWPVHGPDSAELTVPADRLLSVELITETPAIETHVSSVDYSIQLKFLGLDGQPAQRIVLQTSHGAEAGWLVEWLDEWLTAARQSVQASEA